MAYRQLYEHTKDRQALAISIHFASKAAEESSAVNPDRDLAMTSNVALESLEQYRADGNRQSLDQALSLLREKWLRRLREIRGTSRAMRKSRECATAFLPAPGRSYEVYNEMVTVERQAVQATPDSPDGAKWHNNLGVSLLISWRSNGDVGALGEARDLFRKAASWKNASPTVRVMAARSWGESAMDLGEADDALAAYRLTIHLLPVVVSHWLVRRDRLNLIRRLDGLPAEAATAAALCSLPDEAVQMLKTRVTFNGEALSAKVDLRKVSTAAPTL